MVSMIYQSIEKVNCVTFTSCILKCCMEKASYDFGLVTRCTGARKDMRNFNEHCQKRLDIESHSSKSRSGIHWFKVRQRIVVKFAVYFLRILRSWHVRQDYVRFTVNVVCLHSMIESWFFVDSKVGFGSQ